MWTLGPFLIIPLIITSDLNELGCSPYLPNPLLFASIKHPSNSLFSPLPPFTWIRPPCGDCPICLFFLQTRLVTFLIRSFLFAAFLAKNPVLICSWDDRGTGSWRSFHSDHFCTKAGDHWVIGRYCELPSLWQKLHCVYAQLFVLWEGPGLEPQAGERCPGKYGTRTSMSGGGGCNGTHHWASLMNESDILNSCVFQNYPWDTLDFIMQGAPSLVQFLIQES